MRPISEVDELLRGVRERSYCHPQTAQTLVEDGLASRVEQGTATIADIYFVPAVVTAMLPFWLVKKSRLAIRIARHDNEEKRSTAVLLNKKDSREVFKQLRQVLGPQWSERTKTTISPGERDGYWVQFEEDRLLPVPEPVQEVKALDVSHLTSDELFEK